MHHKTTLIQILIFAALLIQPSSAYTLALIDSETNPNAYNETLYTIESPIPHRFPPTILLVDNDTSILPQITGTTYYSAGEQITYTGSDKTTQYVINSWNKNFVPPSLSMGEAPYSISSSSDSLPLLNKDIMPATPYGAEFYDTSEYMIGDVAVSAILLESDNALIENVYDWNETKEENVVTGIYSGLDWWIKQARNNSIPLSFTYKFTFSNIIPYEPTTHPSIECVSNCDNESRVDAPIWIPKPYGELFSDNNKLRNEIATDWAFTMYIVDGKNFTDGAFAFAYLGGSYMVMTYENDGYGISNMNAVTAHEVGHIFYANDQYEQVNVIYSGCDVLSGYLGIPNHNSKLCSDIGVGSIMRGQVEPFEKYWLDTYAAQQIGWRQNGSSIPEILDFKPIITINSPSIASNINKISNISFSIVSSGKLENKNPIHLGTKGNDITINKIRSIKYAIDGAEYKIYDVKDNPNKNLWISTLDDHIDLSSLSDGLHQIEIEATNTVNLTNRIDIVFNLDSIAPRINVTYSYTSLLLNLNLVTSEPISPENTILQLNGANKSYIHNIPLSPGNTYTFRVFGSDAAGNWNSTQQYTFTAPMSYNPGDETVPEHPIVYNTPTPSSGSSGVARPTAAPSGSSGVEVPEHPITYDTVPMNTPQTATIQDTAEQTPKLSPIFQIIAILVAVYAVSMIYFERRKQK